MESLQEKVSALLQTHHDGEKVTLTMMGVTVGATRWIIDPLLAFLGQEGVTVRRLRRGWDEELWPHATHGFFRFKAQIPAVLRRFA
jgi:deoxyribodipyrimidine photo-lyase